MPAMFIATWITYRIYLLPHADAEYHASIDACVISHTLHCEFDTSVPEQLARCCMRRHMPGSTM